MTQSFRLLKDLLARLSKKEVVSLKKKITLNLDAKDERRIKSLHVVNLILNNPELSELQTHRELYSPLNKVAFLKLIERIIEKIDEVYISFIKDIGPFYSERNFYFFYLKRKLLVLQMRWLRGIDFDLGMQFEKIISLSKKYELYDCLIEALLAKQRFVGFRQGKKAFDKIENDILKYEANRKALQRARSLFTMLSTKFNQSNSPNEYKKELEATILLLKQDYDLTKSNTVGYYLFYLETELLNMNEKFEVAENTLNKLLDLVVNNPSVYTRTRHGDIVANLSSNELYLGNFDEAVKNAVYAKSFYEKKSLPLDVAKEVEFFARFYKGELDIAAKIIDEIYYSSLKNNIPFLSSKRAYLYACIATMKGEIEKSNQLLQEVNEIVKNKGGWNLGKRILTIINCIEAGDYESADLKVLSLEKFVKRISKSHHIRKRDVIILRILLKLINEGFDFDSVYKKRRRYFDLLESKDPDYCWKIKSPELIVFHEWFKKKLKKNKIARELKTA